MAYRFKRSEEISHAIRRVFAEEIAWAVGRLTHSKKRVEAVHEARKSTKKIRGLLSLVAPRLGRGYKTQDRYFRDAARLLTDVRDNAVMLQVFDALAVKHPEMDGAALAALRSNLQRRERETRAERDVSSEVVRLLQLASSQAQTWPLADLEFEMVLPALTATYRSGRKAFKRAQKAGTPENMHELRKKVKQHWYHLRLFENPSDRGMKKRLAELHDLETWLGDEHNLNVLRERLTADAETARDRHLTNQFVAWLDDESQALRKRALEAGERLYAEKAAAFSRRLAALWAPSRKAPASSALQANSAVA